MTLQEFNNDTPITYLWICGVGCPAGRDYHHDTDSDGEDYCDFAELEILDRLWDLSGTVDPGGVWCWDGTGNPTDEQGNTVQSVKAN